ncbi:MAG: hypothetical protein LBJ16_00440, partial [Holosporaceae bacterium]|nr:hypothetical protein [Holosporaceae bacterium]
MGPAISNKLSENGIIKANHGNYFYVRNPGLQAPWNAKLPIAVCCISTNKTIDFFRNTRSFGNFCVASVLGSSCTTCTLRSCAPYAPINSSKYLC